MEPFNSAAPYAGISAFVPEAHFFKGKDRNECSQTMTYKALPFLSHHAFRSFRAWRQSNAWKFEATFPEAEELSALAIADALFDPWPYAPHLRFEMEIEAAR